MAPSGNFVSLRLFFIIGLSAVAVYSITSALVPRIYFTKRALPPRVNLNMLEAVISFLLITLSTPISSARRMYSIFSTSATVRGTPSFLAITQVSTLVSSLPVRATKASHSLIPSSKSRSELRPSPSTTSMLSSRSSVSLTQRSWSISMSLTSIPWE